MEGERRGEEGMGGNGTEGKGGRGKKRGEKLEAELYE